MKIYIKFLFLNYYKSFFYVLLVTLSLVFILNLLTELEFFKDLNVGLSLPLLLSALNSPAMIFEIFPFIFLITTQLFFIKLFNNNELEIFKYSGLKNTNLLFIVGSFAFVTGILIMTVFYNLSSNFKNIYLDIKSDYTTDGKYLAVITKNGLWIKDKVGPKIYMINSSEIKNNFLTNSFITEFDENYNVVRNNKSSKIDITNKEWKIFDAKIFKDDVYTNKDLIKMNTNFNHERIKTLYSNLNSFNLLELLELRKNYKDLKYSLIEVDLQLKKIITYPIILVLMTFFSSAIMFRVKRLDNTTLKISLGLFFSVIIYYINNFFFVMGSTEKISTFGAIMIPIILLIITNIFILRKVNEK